MREFTQAEIEYFIDPNDKSHPKFNKIKDYKIPLLTNKMQLENKNLLNISIEEALEKGMISHQTMGYYLARIHMFSKIIGLDENKIRFRQHLPNEMAHYASECWDLETWVNNDWLECIGCADRSDYDLKAHSHTNSLKLRRVLKEPIINKKSFFVLNKKLISKTFKKLIGPIIVYFESLNDDQLQQILEKLQSGIDNIPIDVEGVKSIPNDMFDIKETITKTTFEEYYPHAIEPSFGIDRLLYSIFSHNFWTRKEDINRVVLSLPYILTPYDIAIFPLYLKQNMIDICYDIRELLKSNDFTCYVDNSNVSIGRRYSRLDELSVKYATTVDPGYFKDNKVKQSEIEIVLFKLE